MTTLFNKQTRLFVIFEKLISNLVRSFCPLGPEEVNSLFCIFQNFSSVSSFPVITGVTGRHHRSLLLSSDGPKFYRNFSSPPDNVSPPCKRRAVGKGTPKSVSTPYLSEEA